MEREEGGREEDDPGSLDREASDAKTRLDCRIDFPGIS